MKIKAIFTTLLLGLAIAQPVYAEKSDTFTQNLAKMSPEEKAPLVRMIVNMLNDEMQKKYRNDPTINNVSVNLADLNTLALKMNLKPDERMAQISQDADAAKVLKTLFEQQIGTAFCWKTAKDKEMFEALSITHIQTQIHSGSLLLSNKRIPITWCSNSKH